MHHPLFNRIFAFLTASLLLLSCAVSAQGLSSGAACIDEKAVTALLDGTVFFGESTTAHLARRGGVLDTPAWRRQVWRDASGTRMLDRRLLATGVLYEENGVTASLSVADALAREQPARILLSFGLNGLTAHAKDPARFLSTYRFFLDRIREISPNTKIYLQSVYPVGENTVFSEDVATLNRYIRSLNASLSAACDAWGDTTFLDTSGVLLDADGALAVAFDAGDGIHLTNEAYLKILTVLSEHLGAPTSNERIYEYEKNHDFPACSDPPSLCLRPALPRGSVDLRHLRGLP